MNEKGVTVSREKDFSKWYLQVVRKAGLVDQRTPVKGMDVIKPWGYGVWEIIQSKFDRLIKKNGIKNAYFPAFIPESLLEKEKKHFEGFDAEGAMVTHVGNKELEERLVVRPTSETIMYSMYSKWIRSYKDLPLKLNQWCNIVRWETKMTKPFIRGREFLWQEGHTAHETKKGAERQVKECVNMYKEIYDSMALDALILVRPKHDTFPGADYSVVFDCVVQDGNVIQGPDAHLLGQNFSQPFDIVFTDKNEKEKYVWQTSWGMSTRQLGILVMHHGDDQGVVLPPEIASVQVVIVPIIFEKKKKEIIKACENVKKGLKKIGVRVKVDETDNSPGFKFNKWELKGVPLRIEMGPKEMDEKKIVCVKRNGGEKIRLDVKNMNGVEKLLDNIQEEMLDKSKKMMKGFIQDCKTMKELKTVTKKGVGRANWCGNDKCAEWIKSKTDGAEIRGTKYGEEEETFDTCVRCGKDAKYVVYIAKAY